MYVDDLSSAIYFIINKKIRKDKRLINHLNKNSLINVGSGQEFTIREFANLINNLTSSNKILKFNKKYPDGTKRKVLDIRVMSKLGWKSKISLKKGLKDTINWYVKEKTK